MVYYNPNTPGGGMLDYYAQQKRDAQNQQQPQQPPPQSQSSTPSLGGLLALARGAHSLYNMGLFGGGGSGASSVGVGAGDVVMPEIAGPALEAPAAETIGAGTEAGVSTGAGAASTGAGVAGTGALAAYSIPIAGAVMATAPITAPYIMKGGDWLSKKLGIWSEGGNRPFDPEIFSNSNILADQYQGFRDIPLAAREAIANEANAEGLARMPGRGHYTGANNTGNFVTDTGLGTEFIKPYEPDFSEFGEGGRFALPGSYEAEQRKPLDQQIANQYDLSGKRRAEVMDLNKQIQDALVKQQLQSAMIHGAK